MFKFSLINVLLMNLNTTAYYTKFEPNEITIVSIILVNLNNLLFFLNKIASCILNIFAPLFFKSKAEAIEISVRESMSLLFEISPRKDFLMFQLILENY